MAQLMCTYFRCSKMETSRTLTVFIIVITLLVFYVSGAYSASKFDFDKASKTAVILETQIELSISVKNLRDFAFVHKMCVTYTRPLDGTRSWFEYHRTEVLSGTNSPEFVEKVLVPHLFHEKRELKFQIFTRGREYDNTIDLDKVFSGGYATCNLAELMNVKKLELPLRFDDGKKKNLGLVVIRAEKLVDKCDKIELKFRGENLSIPDRWFSFKEPHFKIFKEVQTIQKKEDQSEPAKEYTLVYRSQPKYSVDGSNLEWDYSAILTNSLCNGVRERKLKFVCRNNQDPIGEFETSLHEMQREKTKFTLIKTTGKAAGQIIIQDFKLTPTYPFAEFLKKGLQIRCYVAIDFTTIEKPHEYKYEEAIPLAITALEDYIWDGKFAIFGFGARNEDGSFNDKFSLNLSAEGVKGVLNAYRKKLLFVTPGINANVGPIIEMVGKEFGVGRKSTEYAILLVIMHGIFSKSQESTFIDALKRIDYRYEALAVIILGMNDTNLAKMKDLYNKKVNNAYYSRDTVNFIPFNQFTSYDNDDAKSYFRTELLAKLPRQVVKFMSENKLEPGT